MTDSIGEAHKKGNEYHVIAVDDEGVTKMTQFWEHTEALGM